MTPAAPVLLALDAVILAVTDDAPRVLTIAAEDGLDALPSGALDLERDPTLERALRGSVAAQTGLELGYVEQLYTFGDRHRDPREHDEGRRVIAVAYLALVREHGHAAEKSRYCDVYLFLPWEDWRGGRPALIDETLKPLLRDWAGDDAERRERIELGFGLDGAPWDPERTLERYELLWETGLVAESALLRRRDDPPVPVAAAGDRAYDPPSGRPMALDHRRMLASALGRVRGKLKYRPVVFELIGAEFTLLQLQRTVEALAGARLHKQNFRRLVETGGLVEGTGRHDHGTRGRPAELFRFRHDVFRERPAPGVYFAGAWWSR